MEVFQYLSSLISPISLKTILRKKYVEGSKIILDLEDGINDSFYSEKSIINKEKARANLLRLNIKDDNCLLGIRINHPDTDEFLKDIRFLNECKNLSFRYVVLPKITSYKELLSATKYISGFNFEEVICCIESEKGIEHLPEILQKYNLPYKLKIQFGHYDYFLDQQLFPIPDFKNPLFAEVSKRIIDICNHYKFPFLQSPCNRLKDETSFKFMLDQLNKSCFHGSGIATINFSQSEVILNIINKNCEQKKKPNNKTLSFTAGYILKNYKGNPKGSFLLDTVNDFFIAPHDFISAKNNLEKWPAKN